MFLGALYDDSLPMADNVVAIWKFFIVAECKAGKSCDKQAIDQ